MTPKISLFVTTYEMPHALELVLAGISRQTFSDFELWICDDGSGEQTRRIIENYKTNHLDSSSKTQASHPVHHVWQPNQGFRKCRILNAALRQARGELCVFLDGDCVPHPRFLEDHWRFARPGHYCAGRRVELGRKWSESLSAQDVSRGILDKPSPTLMWSFFSGDSKYLNRMFRITHPTLRQKLRLDFVHDLKGCNYSVSRQDLIRIDGFDEAFEGYGREDTDVELRLQNLGLKIRSLKGVALQYHVWHPRREFTPENDQTLEDVKKTGRVRSTLGLSSGQFLGNGDPQL